MKTLVIGGTGTVGSLVVSGLLAKGETVRLMTRSAEKAKSAAKGVETVVADLTDPTTATAAFEGVDAVFMLNPVSPTEAHEGLIGVACARNAKVKRFVYMGVHNAHVAPYIPHFGSKIAIEAAIKTSGMSYTFLQPNNFMQNDFWFKDVVSKFGIYPQPIGDVGISRVDVRDIADAAVNALTKTGFENKAYVLAGPKPWNGSATAEVFSAAMGKKITYGGNDLVAWAKQAGAMMPAWMTFDMAVMYAMFQELGLKATDAELKACESVVGHPLRTFEDFVKEVTPSWK